MSPFPKPSHPIGSVAIELGEGRRKGIRARVEFLSDLTFDLAQFIGALAIASNPPVTDHEFNYDVGTFSIWFRCARIMPVLQLETRGTVLLNGVLLFTVALEPSIFNILRSINAVTPLQSPLLGRVLIFRLGPAAIEILTVDYSLAFSRLRSGITESLALPRHHVKRVPLGASLNSMPTGIRNPCKS